LINGVSVIQPQEEDEFTYFHIELEQHDILVANGAMAESFLDDNCRGQFHNATEYHARYPNALPMVPLAARLEDGFCLQGIQERIAIRAGVFLSIEPAGPLCGFVDVAGPTRVSGWAQDEDSPEEPVALEVLVGDLPVVCILANGYRADLRNVGVGSGCHAFAFDLAPEFIGAVSVRRILDGAQLPLTEAAAAYEQVAA
jgi:hypothetical protein